MDYRHKRYFPAKRHQPLLLTGTASLWTSDRAEHIYGLPEVKAHKIGTLTLSPDGLTLPGKENSTTIPSNTITAISAGDQRV
jgi:hypothetical protein